MVSLQRVLEPEPPSPQASVPVELTVHKRILIEVRVRSQWRTLATASLPLALTVFSLLGARLTHHLLLQLRRRATLQLCLALARLGCPRREDLLVLRISLTRDRGLALESLPKYIRRVFRRAPPSIREFFSTPSWVNPLSRLFE